MILLIIYWQTWDELCHSASFISPIISCQICSFDAINVYSRRTLVVTASAADSIDLIQRTRRWRWRRRRFFSFVLRRRWVTLHTVILLFLLPFFLNRSRRAHTHIDIHRGKERASQSANTTISTTITTSSSSSFLSFTLSLFHSRSFFFYYCARVHFIARVTSTFSSLSFSDQSR